MALDPVVYMFDEPTAGMSVDEVPVILDRFFIRFRHWRRVAIDGDSPQLQLQRQLSLRGTECMCSACIA